MGSIQLPGKPITLQEQANDFKKIAA